MLKWLTLKGSFGDVYAWYCDPNASWHWMLGGYCSPGKRPVFVKSNSLLVGFTWSSKHSAFAFLFNSKQQKWKQHQKNKKYNEGENKLI